MGKTGEGSSVQRAVNCPSGMFSVFATSADKQILICTVSLTSLWVTKPAFSFQCDSVQSSVSWTCIPSK